MPKWKPSAAHRDARDMVYAPLRFTELYGRTGSVALAGCQAGLWLANRVVRDEVGTTQPLYEPNRALLGPDWTTEHGTFSGKPVHIAVAEVDPGDSKTVMAAWRYAVRAKAAVLALVSPLELGTAESALSAVRVHREGMEMYEGIRKYMITHLLLDDLGCGGASNAERCVTLLSQVPLSFDEPSPTWLPSPEVAYGDLDHVLYGWEQRAIKDDPTWWSAPLRAADHTVDGHEPFSDTDGTPRELARLLGFPDDWSLEATRHLPEELMLRLWAATAPVPMMRWMLEQVAASLSGRGGPSAGQETGRLERTLDLRGLWRAQAERQGLDL